MATSTGEAGMFWLNDKELEQLATSRESVLIWSRGRSQSHYGAHATPETRCCVERRAASPNVRLDLTRNIGSFLPSFSIPLFPGSELREEQVASGESPAGKGLAMSSTQR